MAGNQRQQNLGSWENFAFSWVIGSHARVGIRAGAWSGLCFREIALGLCVRWTGREDRGRNQKGWPHISDARELGLNHFLSAW